MVLPYVHATAMVLTLISTAVHPQGVARRRLEDGIAREAEAGRRVWLGLQEISKGAISSLSKTRSTMIPAERCLLAGAPISLSHGELAATANSYRFIDAENSLRVRSVAFRTDEMNERVSINSCYRITLSWMKEDTIFWSNKRLNPS